MTAPIKPSTTAVTPGGQSLVDDVPLPNDLIRYGRYWPNVEPDPIWVPVCEEAPPSGPWMREQGKWVAAAAGGLSVTEIIPAVLTAGTAPTTVNVYGTGFTATTVILFDGTAVTAVLVTPDHMTVAVDPTLAVPAVITVTASEGGVAGLGAAGLHVVPASTSTPTVTEIVPDMATVGFSVALQANVYGTGFIDGTSQVLWDGVPLATAFISANQLGITIDTTLGVAPSSVTITVASATGAAGFVFVPESSSVDAGLGLSMDKTTTPNPTINLQPAGDGPPTLGGVYVVDRVRNVSEGLELGIDGRLRAPLATDSLAGTILEPPPDDKGYVRRRDLLGNSAWVPPATTTGPDFGIGLSLNDPVDPADPQVVNLTPAGWAPQFLGGVYTVGPRTATEGLDLAAAGTGELSVPLATDLLAGSIVEPPPDDKGYVRRRDLAGNSAWVPPADTPGYDYGIGLAVDRTPVPPDQPIVNLTPAGWYPQFLGGVFVPPRDNLLQGLHTIGDGELTAPPASDLLLGVLTEPPPDGMAYSRQWDNVTDPANPRWVWVPALTAGLQITSIIPDKAIYGPTEPLLTVHAYGSEFTPTCVIYVDANPAQTTYVSATELTFLLNPAVPAVESFHIITVQDPAAVAPDPVLGLGAEQFDFIKASTEVDYGLGLALDTLPTPPMVNLTPAGWYPQFLGGVYVPPRDATQGAEISNDPADPGKLIVPLATDLLAGAITEPPPDDKGYVRRRDLLGVSQWVPPALPPGANLEYRVGLNDRRPIGEEIIDLKIASTNGEIGGVYCFAQGPTNGLAFDPTTGAIWAPPATPDVLGTITEPIADDKGYVRRTTLAGVSEWVPPALPPDSTLTYGIGLLDQRPAGIENIDLKIATTNGEIGGVYPFGRGPTNGLDFDPNTGAIWAPPATPDLLGTIKEPVADGKGYVRASQPDGTFQWVPPATEAKLEYRIGLLDQRPMGQDIIDLKIASTNGEIGGVYCFGRGPTNGLDFDPNTGAIWAPPATDILLGTIIEPPPDGNAYARKRGTAGVSIWEQVETGGLMDVPRDPVGETYVRSWGRWLPTDRNVGAQPRKVNVGGDVMTGELILYGDPIDLYGAVPLHMLNDVKVYVDAQDTILEAKMIEEAPNDGNIYGRQFEQWERIPDAASPVDYGIGLELTGTTVDLKPANFNGEIGGVTVVAQSPLNGLAYDIMTGTLWAPPATPDLPGVITEPVADGKGYVRASQPNGTYQWVPPAPSGGSVTISDTPPTAPASGDLWWESDSGAMFIWYDDGTSTQWVQVNGESAPELVFVSDAPPPTPYPNQLWWDSDSGTLAIWYQDVDSAQWVQINSSGAAGGDFLPLTGGTVTGPIVLPVADPTLPEHATHKKYVDTAVATNSLYQSTWQVAANIPDLNPAVALPLNGYSWTAVTVDASIPETALASLPGIGGASIASGDTIKYNATLAIYEQIRTASSAGGIGDAPSDTTTYGRQDAGWVNVLPLTGGVMTGRIDINTGISLGLRFCSTAGLPTLALSASSSTHTGIIEFFDQNGTTRRGYIGYGSATWLDIVAENGAKWKFANDVTFNGAKFGSAAAASVTDMSKHIDLYGASYGFCITGSTLNYNCATGAVHKFNINGVETATIAAAAIELKTAVNARGVINCYDRLRIMTGEELWLDNSMMKVPEGSRIQFHDAANFFASTNNNRIRYDSDDSHRFFIAGSNVFSVTSGGGALLSLNSVADDLGLPKDDDVGVSIGAAMIAMLAKIKQLEAKIDQLERGAYRGV